MSFLPVETFWNCWWASVCKTASLCAPLTCAIYIRALIDCTFLRLFHIAFIDFGRTNPNTLDFSSSWWILYWTFNLCNLRDTPGKSPKDSQQDCRLQLWIHWCSAFYMGYISLDIQSHKHGWKVRKQTPKKHTDPTPYFWRGYDSPGCLAGIYPPVYYNIAIAGIFPQFQCRKIHRVNQKVHLKRCYVSFSQRLGPTTQAAQVDINSPFHWRTIAQVSFFDIVSP